MPTTSKRFYIVRADDHAVIKSVPVSVCAAPPRAELGPASERQSGETAQAESAVRVGNRPDSSGSVIAGRAGGRFPRPHLPHIGRSGR